MIYPINELFFTVRPRQSNSWALKCILKNQQEFRRGIRWKVSNGTLTNLWLDNWCDNDNLASLMGLHDTSSTDISRNNNNNNNNNNSQCGSCFRGVWGDPAVGNLTPTGISTHREVDSLKPTKPFLKKVYKENDYKPKTKE